MRLITAAIYFCGWISVFALHDETGDIRNLLLKAQLSEEFILESFKRVGDQDKNPVRSTKDSKFSTWLKRNYSRVTYSKMKSELPTGTTNNNQIITKTDLIFTFNFKIPKMSNDISKVVRSINNTHFYRNLNFLKNRIGMKSFKQNSKRNINVQYANMTANSKVSTFVTESRIETIGASNASTSNSNNGDIIKIHSNNSIKTTIADDFSTSHLPEIKSNNDSIKSINEISEIKPYTSTYHSTTLGIGIKSISDEIIMKVSARNTSSPQNSRISGTSPHISTYHRTIIWIKSNGDKIIPDVLTSDNNTISNRFMDTSNISSWMIASTTAVPVHTKLSKTIVASIVVAIIAFIGIIGAAVFVYMKYKYLRKGERQPLIR